MSNEIKETIERSLFQPSNKMRDIPSEYEMISKNGMNMIVRISPTAKNAVVLFPRNEGNITHHIPLMDQLASINPDSDIWSFDYPGYGKTPGRPTTETIVSMGYHVVTTIQKKYKEWNWVGESIGSSIMWGVLYEGIGGDKTPLNYLPKTMTMINPFKSISSMAKTRQSTINPAPLIKKYGYEMDTELWITDCKKILSNKMPSITIYRSETCPEIPVEQTRDVANVACTFIHHIKGDTTHYKLV